MIASFFDFLEVLRLYHTVVFSKVQEAFHARKSVREMPLDKPQNS